MVTESVGRAPIGAPIIEAKGVSKRWGSVHALHEVDFNVYSGEVVGLVGDNGAGKSTLINILAGALHATTGSIFVNGKEVQFKTPTEARNAGIETVYQDLALAPDLTIWANLFLGREIVKGGLFKWIGWLDRKAMIERSVKDLERTQIRIASVGQRVGRLSGGQRQAVAVGRAVAWGSHVVLMDEPTAALGVEQQARVAELIRTVASHGVPVVLISHNLPQVYAVCDRIVVLFRGRIVAEVRPHDTSIDQIVSYITGSSATKVAE
jgi:ABC-type sugar transport system ATPase subunit